MTQEKTAEVTNWMNKNVKSPRGNCFFYAASAAALHPTMKLIQGQHSNQHMKDTKHFWLEDPHGKIFDPTASQYAEGTYKKEREVDPHENLDAITNDKLFKELDTTDKNKINAMQFNKTAAAADAKKDQELWSAWNKTPTPANMNALLNHTAPIRHHVLSAWGTTVSPVTMNSEAVKHSVAAFKSYDPKRGTKLSTHLTNQLQKVSRVVYEESSFLHIPENRTLKRATYNQADTDLKERLGREPSAEELSDELGWPSREVERFKKETHQLLVASEPIPIGMEGFNPNSDAADPNHKLHYALADMNPVDQQIFRHSTGYNGAPVLSGKEITKAMNINQSQLSYRKRVITDRLNESMPGSSYTKKLKS